MSHPINRSLIFILTALCLFHSLHLFSFECAIFAKAEGQMPLKHIAIYGERCSGTNYTKQLIVANTNLISTPFCTGLPHQTPWHKHFMPWFDLLPTYAEDPRNSNFAEYEDTLFVVVFRDPYDWARSMNLSPQHGADGMYNLHFSQFIRIPWTLNDRDPYIQQLRQQNPLLDCDLRTGLPFKNILKMRNAKIKDELRLKDMVKNIYYVKYETVRDRPKKVLKEISKLFGLPLKPYQPIVDYKGLPEEGAYKPKKYNPIKLKDLFYINSQLDQAQEKQIGYEIKTTIKP